MKPKGGEDWGVCMGTCVCTCVLLFFPITGISFKKPHELANKEVLNMHLGISPRDEGFTVLRLNKVLII